MWTTGLSAPGGLVDNDHRREALRVCFTSEGGGGGGGERGGGEAGGEAMILYTTTYKMEISITDKYGHQQFFM